MKKLNEIYKQYEGLIKLLVMFAPLTFAAWKYLGTYIDMPGRMDGWEGKQKQDSTFYMNMWVKRMHYQDSLNKNFNSWLQQDLDSITAINKKLQKLK